MDVLICGICLEEFHDILKFMDHKSQGTYSCGTCGAVFHTKCEISSHVAEVHHGTVEHSGQEPAIESTVENTATIIVQTDEVADDERPLSRHERYANVTLMQCEQESVSMEENVTDNNETGSTIIRLIPANIENNSKNATVYAIRQEIRDTQATLSLEEVPVPADNTKISPANNEDEAVNTVAVLKEISNSECNIVNIYACKLCHRFSLSKEEISNHLTTVHKISLHEERFFDYVNRLEPVRKNFQEDRTSNTDVQSTKQDIMLVPVGKDLESKTSMVNLCINPLLNKEKCISQQEESMNQPPKKKPGRPRKSSQPSLPKKESIIKRPNIGKKTLSFEQDANGFYHCKNCQKVFKRERHFSSHRCLAASDYIFHSSYQQPSNAEDLVPDDTEDVDTDYTDDFKISHLASRPSWGHRGRGHSRISKQIRKTVPGKKIKGISQSKLEITPKEIKQISSESQQENLSNSIDASNENNPKNDDQRFYVIEKNSSANSGKPNMNWRDDPKHVTVFSSEEEKNEFETYLNATDLSCVDHLYTKHQVPQEINPETVTKTSVKDCLGLVVFSCKVCKKVLKTLSHTRLHCLIHTDLKPFRCPKCDYVSNAKGNLYTHMRKHTGNYFKCTDCNFQTSNRTHLAEHKSIHSNIRHQCKLCLNDYNTIKSLANHVRRYHNGRKGKEYLATFMSKTSTSLSTLHICHICNKKFKKKVDRDLHLFFHNVKTNPNILQCSLCEFVTVKKSILDNHYRRHRLLYACCICESIFLSSIKLQQHLAEHDGTGVTESLFDESISSSWYLPEPDGTISLNRYLYIPEELIESQTSKNTEPMEENNDATENPNDILTIEDDKKEPNDERRLPEALSFCSLNYKSLTLDLYAKIRNAFGNLECELCGRLFHSRTIFENHTMTHTGEKPFKCENCSYAAASKDNLKRHQESIHEGRQFGCTDCNFVANSKSSFWQHRKKHIFSSAYCEICKLNLPSMHILRDHITKKHPEVDKTEIIKLFGSSQSTVRRLGRPSHKCPYCDRVFHRSSSDLQRHMWIHEGLKPYKCQLCSYTCRRKNALTEHMHKHSSDKPFTCNECGKSYKSKPALKFHLKLHGQGIMFSCEMCDFTSPQRNHLKKHLEAVHGVAKLQYSCELCEYSASTALAIKIHYRRKHKEVVLDKEASTNNEVVVEALGKGFRCMSCDCIFDSFTYIQTHLKQFHGVTIEAADLGINAEGTSNLESTQGSLETQEGEVQQKDQLEQVLTESDQLQLQMDEGCCTETVDEKTASAVNIIQKMIEQGALSSAVTLQTTDEGQVTTLNPQTITLQSGQQFLIKSGDKGEYIIQYVTSAEEIDYVVQANSSASYVVAGDHIDRTESQPMEIPRALEETL